MSCTEASFPQFIMARRKGRKLYSPNSPQDPGKSRGGNIKDGMGVVKGTNVKGEAFSFDPSKHKRDPLTGKWATKPDVVKPQKDKKKATKPTSSEAKKTKPSSPFAKFRQRVRDALKQQLINYAKNKSDKSKSTPSKPDSVSTVPVNAKPIEKKNFTLDDYTQRGQEISSKYGLSDNKFLGRLAKLIDKLLSFQEKPSLTPSDMEELKKINDDILETQKKAYEDFEKKVEQLLDDYRENASDLDMDKVILKTRFVRNGFPRDLNEDVDMVREAYKDFHYLTNGNIIGFPNLLDVNNEGNSYAVYPNKPAQSSIVSIGTSGQGEVPLRQATFHELAHLVELHVPGLKEASLEFLKKHSYTGTLENFDYLGVPISGYKGDFIDEYVGRFYVQNSATEVLSTGFERLSNPDSAFKLFVNSNHHFNYILGALDRVNSTRNSESYRLPNKSVRKIPNKSAEEIPNKSAEEIPNKSAEAKNLTLDNYTQRGQEISSKYGLNDTKTLGKLQELSGILREFNTKIMGMYDDPTLTDSDREEVIRQFDEVFKKHKNLEKKFRAKFEKNVQNLLESYKEASKDLDLEKLLENSKFTLYGQELDKSDRNVDLVKESVKDFHSLTKGFLGELVPMIDVDRNGSSYVRYHPDKPEKLTHIRIGAIGLGDEVFKLQTFHQMAHILESHIPGLLKASMEFLKKHSYSGQEEDIEHRGMTYRGYKGDFINNYVGRTYNKGVSATEVISTGFERLRNPTDAFTLYTESNHHFNFILGVLDSINQTEPPKTKLMSSLTQKNLDPKPEPAEPKPTTPKQVSKEYTDTINSAKSKISQFKLDRLVKVFETQDAQINAELKSLDPKNPEDVEKAQKLFARKRKLKQSLDTYLEKQMNLLYQELLDNNNSVNSDLLVGQTNFQIGEYTKNLKPANTEDPIYKTHTPVISKALAEFHKLTGGILNNLVPRIGLSEKKRSWAGFDAKEPQKNNYLSISVTRSNDVKPSVFHEAAHLLEGSDPKFANLAKEFLAKNRTSDELKQIKGYPAGEVAYPGNWVHPYVGKIYKNSPSTEVISMGIERFASPKDMAEFYFKDKEHFALTLGIIESLKVPEHLKPIPATIY